jgi:phage gpG-like protein
MINITLDDGGLRAMLKGVEQSLSDLRPFFDDVHNIFINMEKAQFTSEGSRSGERWEPLNPDYAAWKRARHGDRDMMRLSDRLYGSLTSKGHSEHVFATGPGWMEVGTQVLYARAQHFGYEPGNLPARSLIRVTKAEGEMMVDALLAHILKSTRRASTRSVVRK